MEYGIKKNVAMDVIVEVLAESEISRRSKVVGRRERNVAIATRTHALRVCHSLVSHSQRVVVACAALRSHEGRDLGEAKEEDEKQNGFLIFNRIN